MLEATTFKSQGEDFTVSDIPQIAKAQSTGSSLTRTAIIGNFPPRQCGLATFTRDMYNCLHKALPGARWDVIAMNDPGNTYDYPPEVTKQIAQNEAEAYIRLADDLNASGTQVLFVQHEFGIYGGPSGAYLLDCLERLHMPVVTTLHTILETPNEEQKRVMDGLIRVSATLVTMARKGADILKRVYGVPESKIAIVPHGAPSRPLQDTNDFKAHHGLTGKKVLTTFGLLSPNKGIETVISALPDVVRGTPDLMYLIVGATHPHLIRHEGEKYRDGLKAMARELGVEKHIRFVDKYLSDNDLIDILQATDVYVTPYLTETQITSGTLSYAIALGRPVVSTPYWHAQEALANGVGILCPFHDSQAFGNAISELMESETTREAMSSKAYKYGLSSRWSAVAQAYISRAEDDVKKGRHNIATVTGFTAERPAWDAIQRMSDDTGMYQHGKYRLADRNHGYCTDDNCRALGLVARQSKLGKLDARQLRLAYVYAGFINHAWNPDTGRFRNFMGFDRQWLDDGGSNDCCARTFEALVDVARSDLPTDLRNWAVELGQRVWPRALTWNSMRSRAIVLKTLVRAFGVVGQPQDIQAAIRDLGRTLQNYYKASNTPDHMWFEPTLSYDNARLSDGLILAGQFLSDSALLRDGLASLAWLMKRQTVPVKGCFLPVPTSQFKEDGEVHPFYDQQPLEVVASVEACLTAWRVTGEPEWREEALRAWAWFEGKNSHSVATITADGGCFDGLTVNGCNENQGAESILAYHLSWTALKTELKAEVANAPKEASPPGKTATKELAHSEA